MALGKRISNLTKSISDWFDSLQIRISKASYDSIFVRGFVKVFNLAFQSKISRVSSFIFAIIAFTNPFVGPVAAAALFGVSVFGFAVATISEVVQKRNLRKLQKEEDSLKTLTKYKAKSLKLAPGLELKSDLAKRIGLESLATDGFKVSGNSKAEVRFLRSLSIRNKNIGKKLAVQKNEDGKTSDLKAAKKTLRQNLVQWGSSLATSIANAASPVMLTLSIVSTLWNFRSEKAQRHESSNLKQQLKNNIIEFRKKPTIPPYDDVEELQLFTRKTKLQYFALEKLKDNEVFKEAIRKGDILLLKQLVKTAKASAALEQDALEKSKTFKSFKNKKKNEIEKLKYSKLRKDFKSLREGAIVLLQAEKMKSEKVGADKVTEEINEKDIIKKVEDIATDQAAKEIDKKFAKEKKDLIKEVISSYRKKASEQDMQIHAYEFKDKNGSLSHLKRFFLDMFDSINIFRLENFSIKTDKLKKLSTDVIDAPKRIVAAKSQEFEAEKRLQNVLDVHKQRAILQPLKDMQCANFSGDKTIEIRSSEIKVELDKYKIFSHYFQKAPKAGYDIRICRATNSIVRKGSKARRFSLEKRLP
jgi:hypothetical protein